MLKVSAVTVSHDTDREKVTTLSDGCIDNIQMVKLSAFDSVSVLQDVIKIKRLREGWVTQASLEMQLQEKVLRIL